MSSLLLNQPSKLLCFRRKPVLVRSSPLSCNDFSSSLQYFPCVLICSDPCGGDRGKAVIIKSHGGPRFTFEESEKSWESDEEFEKRRENEKRLSRELKKEMGTTGSSNGWLPTLKEGVLSLRDMNLNPGTDPKRIRLPPLVTLPYCQTKHVTNVAMSSSPEEEDCVVAVKFLGPQLSFCRPAQTNPEWINIRIENPCFFSSTVMFSNKDNMFRIVGSGGHLIGSWDLHKYSKIPKLQSLRFQNLPKLTKAKRDLLDSCYTSEHLVESRTTNETFLVKWYRKTTRKIIDGIVKMRTEYLMVFKLDEEGNALYTQDIGAQSIFLTNSEAFCDPFSFHLCMLLPNRVKIVDVDERIQIRLDDQEWSCSRRQSPTLQYYSMWFWL